MADVAPAKFQGTTGALVTVAYTDDNQIDSRKYIVGTSMTPAFVITSLRSEEVANSLAFFVSVVSKMMTISVLSSAERSTRGLLKPFAFCIAECESNAGRHLL